MMSFVSLLGILHKTIKIFKKSSSHIFLIIILELHLNSGLTGSSRVGQQWSCSVDVTH